MRMDWRAFVLPAILLALAEIGARVNGASDSVAPPSEVLVAFAGALADGSLIVATRDTLACAFAGLAIGGDHRAHRSAFCSAASARSTA